jgi:hypothetical protein
VQPSLVVLLLACIALAALGFYLGFVLRVWPLGWLPQATFVFMAALHAAAATDLGSHELPEHRDGWEVVSRSEGMWILERGERRMVVTLAASGAARSIGYAAVR